MNIILWLLSVLFSLYALTALLSVFQGQAILSFLLALVVVALVFPPLHPWISKKVSWLKSKALRIFLAIVLFIVSFSMAPSAEKVAFDSMTVCAETSVNECQVTNTRFAEQTPQIFIAATSEDLISEVELKIVNKDAKASEPIVKTYSGEKLKTGEQSYLIPVETAQLDVGTYDVSIAPIVTEGVISGASKQEITVWPQQSDVERREAGGELAEVSSFRLIKDVKVCGLTVKQAEDEAFKCETSTTEIPSNSEAVGFLAEIGNPGKKDVKLDFTFRGKEEGQSIVVIERTFDVSSKDGYVMYSLTFPDGGMTPGDYDVVVSMQTKEAKPIRKPLTLTS